MSTLGDVVARMKSNCPVLENRASIARSLNNPDPTALPEAWVHRWTSIANGSSETFAKIRQSESRQIGIIYATAMEDEADNIDHHEVARRQIMAAVLGYEVGTGPLPLEFVNEQFMSIEEGYTLQRLTFQFIEHIRN